MDTSRLEISIRSLPGVVACQFTPTSVLVLVGPTGDAAAVNTQVATLLAEVAAERSVHVLAAPKPAAVVAIRGWRGRGRAAVAVAGTMAALTASVAAAATVAVVRVDREHPANDAADEIASGPLLSPSFGHAPPLADQVPSRPATAGAATATPAPEPAPVSPTVEPAPAPVAEPAAAVAATRPRRVTKTSDGASQVPAPSPAPAAPVIVEVPLPPALVQPVLTASSFAPDDEDDGAPHGVARRVRKGGHAPAGSASPVATTEGSKERRS